MKNFSRYLKIIFLILLSLTPVFWFIRRPGILIDGVDTNFPLDPSIWFKRRFFVWTAVSNAGADFSASTAGTFFHFLQFLPYKLGFSLQIVEIFSLLFWFSLIIFSSWFLSRLFFPKKSIPQIVFVVLYCLNIWFFNTWENIKVANLALAAAIPLGLSILILLRERKIKRGSAAILSILTGIILAGAGINPAYIICFFLILSIYLFAEIFTDFGNWNLIIERLKDLVLVGIFITLVNAFWILPSLSFIFGSISSSNSIGALGFTNWVDSLSQNTSFVNIIRMQGAWDWYAFDSVSGLPLYIPYSLNYFFNPIFIIFSFLIPSLALLSFVFRKKKNSLLFITFAVMLVIGIFLTAGTHQPTGSLFAFFVTHIPFFSLFRSPWYIFAPLVGLSIAGLVSMFFVNIYDIFPKRVVYIFGIIFTIGVLFYSYPLLLGKIYRPGVKNGFFIKFPVYEVRDYLAKTKINGRILSYPDDNIERFNWGYSGTDSILNLFSDKEVVFSPLNDTTSSMAKMVTDMYLGLKKGEITIVKNLADKLTVTEIFDKRDQDSLSPSLPKGIQDNKIVNFGKWSFYNLSNKSGISQKISVQNCCSLSYPYSESDLNLSVLSGNQLLVNPNDSLFMHSKLLITTGAVIHANNSQFSDYTSMDTSPSDLKSRLFTRDLSTVFFNIDIPKSGNYSPILEKYGVDLFGIVNQNKVNVMVDGKSEVWTINNLDDSYLYFQTISLSQGKHEVSLDLKNRNLINQASFSEHGTGTFGFSNGIFNIFNQSPKDISFDFPITDFDPYAYYLVDLSYYQIYGNNAQVLIDQRSKTTLFKDQTQALPNYPGWQDFSFYYHPVQSDSNLNISLVSPQTKDPLGTKIQYKSLGVYRVFSNNLFFKMEQVTSEKTADITYTEISPVSYSGKLRGGSGPQVILFNENYSSNWQFSISGNSSARIFHFTGNSYANAWYVEGAGTDFNFTIKYKPQSLLNIGYVITVISIIGGIVYFIYDNTRRKNGR